MNLSKLMVGLCVIFSFMLIANQCEVVAIILQQNSFSPAGDLGVLPVGNLSYDSDGQIEIVEREVTDKGIDLIFRYNGRLHKIERNNIPGLVIYSLPAVLCPLSDKAVIVIQKSINVDSAERALNPKTKDKHKKEVVRSFFIDLSDEGIRNVLSECDGDTCDYMEIIGIDFSDSEVEKEIEFRDGNSIKAAFLPIEPEKILVSYKTDLGVVNDEQILIDASEREIIDRFYFKNFNDFESSNNHPIWLVLKNRKLSIYNSDLHDEIYSVTPLNLDLSKGGSLLTFLKEEDGGNVEYVDVRGSKRNGEKYYVRYKIEETVDGEYKLVFSESGNLNTIFLPLTMRGH